MSTLELPDEATLAAQKRKQIARQENQGKEPGELGSIPSWKVLGGSFLYPVGQLAFRLKAPSIRATQRVHEALERLPDMLTLASLCGVDKDGVRLDFARMAEIWSAAGVPTTPEMAAAAWRIFCKDQLPDAIPDLCDALYAVLDDSREQGYHWPRPVPEAPPLVPGEDATPEELLQFPLAFQAWEDGYRESVEKALPPGCRWLDDALADGLTELQIAVLPVIIQDALGGYPGDVREAFTSA